MVHAIALPAEGPLQLYRRAEENEDECKNGCPEYYDNAGAVDPEAEADAERPEVEAHLAELESCQRPDVEYREDKGELPRISVEYVLFVAGVWNLPAEYIPYYN